jgi:hypothetical protein
MRGAIEALEADRGALLEICAGLGDADWKADSGCEGWTVQDVVAHMGALFWMVVEPTVPPTPPIFRPSGPRMSMSRLGDRGGLPRSWPTMRR